MPYVQYKDLDIWIDEEDIKWLAKYEYYVTPQGYLRRKDRPNGDSFLHRDIVQCPEGFEVDHINGDKRDNRKQNLRILSPGENNQGFRSRRKDNKHGITGVYWSKQKQKWIAKIMVHGKDMHLCQTDDFFEACCARKSAENKYKNNVGL